MNNQKEEKRKRCSICGHIKLLSAFHKNPEGKSGYHAQCRVCRNDQFRDYWGENQQKVNIRRKVYRAADKNRKPMVAESIHKKMGRLSNDQVIQYEKKCARKIENLPESSLEIFLSPETIAKLGGAKRLMDLMLKGLKYEHLQAERKK